MSRKMDKSNVQGRICLSTSRIMLRGTSSVGSAPPDHTGPEHPRPCPEKNHPASQTQTTPVPQPATADKNPRSALRVSLSWLSFANLPGTWICATHIKFQGFAPQNAYGHKRPGLYSHVPVLWSWAEQALPFYQLNFRIPG